MDNEITDFLKQTIVSLAHMKTDEIRDDSNIFDELGIDSVSALQIIAAVEEKYGIRFEDWDLVNFNTVAKIALQIEEELEDIYNGSYGGENGYTN